MLRADAKEEVKPWAKICTESCWDAVEVKCTCRCGGLHHGEGIMLSKMDAFMEAPNDNPMADAPPLTSLNKTPLTLGEIDHVIISNGGKCVSCHTPLRWGSIEAYPHMGGVDIEGNGKVRKLWVYFKCGCGYQSALWKVLERLEKKVRGTRGDKYE